MRKILLFPLFLLCVGCTSQLPVSLQISLIGNDTPQPGQCEYTLTITNNSSQPLEQNWHLYCGLMSLQPVFCEGDELRDSSICASYHTIFPTAYFRPIPPLSSQTYTLRYKGFAIRENMAPEGFFFVLNDQKPISIPCSYTPYSSRKQATCTTHWIHTPYADGEYVYSYNQHILSTDTPLYSPSLPLIPSPKKVIYHEGTCIVSRSTFVTRLNANMIDEGYSLILSTDSIFIETNDSCGLFYAQRTLQQLVHNMGDTLPQMRLIDWPDLHHRGLMLDIVRHFYPLDSILRVVDVMADYKLNVLHLHISDDEGWRLQIPDLPQLTNIASRRGYTKDEKDCLFPTYSGGWDYLDSHSMANGYLSTEDYIHLIRYAGERHICIIPEVDMPGHMRACKKALPNLLSDSIMDARPYKSVQHYTDNVIAVNLPSAIQFIDKVISEIVQMHQLAGYPLLCFNIGGDEVPTGALTHEEHQCFMDSVLSILQKHNLQPVGWEEIDHFCSPQSGAICYSWHSDDTKSIELASKGYQVILANADRLYFDFAYCNHHQERGLDWGGYTDEYSSFNWQPLQHPNVVGMNAQLWGEVIRSFSQVEWQLYPKIFGLCERSWNMSSPLSLHQYSDLIYRYCLPSLYQNGHNFHLQQPGIHLHNDTLYMNTVIPEAQIFYTLNDSSWQLYTEPITIDTTLLHTSAPRIKAKLTYLNHTSNTTWY